MWPIDKLHPFDTKVSCVLCALSHNECAQKYGKIFDSLLVSGTISADQAHAPSMPSRDDLLQVHTAAYLDSLNSSRVCADVIEIGPVAFLPNAVIRKALLEPMLLGTRSLQG